MLAEVNMQAMRHDVSWITTLHHDGYIVLLFRVRAMKFAKDIKYGVDKSFIVSLGLCR